MSTPLPGGAIAVAKLSMPICIVEPPFDYAFAAQLKIKSDPCAEKMFPFGVKLAIGRVPVEIIQKDAESARISVKAEGDPQLGIGIGIPVYFLLPLNILSQ